MNASSWLMTIRKRHLGLYPRQHRPEENTAHLQASCQVRVGRPRTRALAEDPVGGLGLSSAKKWWKVRF